MDERLLRADELGVRLEIVGGLPLWEAHPVYKHQKAIDRISQTIHITASACACVHASDVYVSFPTVRSDAPTSPSSAANRMKKKRPLQRFAVE